MRPDFQKALPGGGNVLVAFLDRFALFARRTQLGNELVRDVSEPGAGNVLVLEVIQIDQVLPFDRSGNDPSKDRGISVRVSIGRQAHDLVFVVGTLKAEVIREGGVEDTQ